MPLSRVRAPAGGASAPRQLALQWWYEHLLCMEEVDPEAIHSLGELVTAHVKSADFAAPVAARLYLRSLHPDHAGAARLAADSEDGLTVLGFILGLAVQRGAEFPGGAAGARGVLPPAALLEDSAALLLARRAAAAVRKDRAAPPARALGDELARLLAGGNLQSLAAGAGMAARKARILKELSSAPAAKGLSVAAAKALAARLDGLFSAPALTRARDAYARAAWEALGPSYLAAHEREVLSGGAEAAAAGHASYSAVAKPKAAPAAAAAPAPEAAAVPASPTAPRRGRPPAAAAAAAAAPAAAAAAASKASSGKTASAPPPPPAAAAPAGRERRLRSGKGAAEAPAAEEAPEEEGPKGKKGKKGKKGAKRSAAEAEAEAAAAEAEAAAAAKAEAAAEAEAAAGGSGGGAESLPGEAPAGPHVLPGSPSVKRRKVCRWTPEETDIFTHAVYTYGAGNWKAVLESVGYQLNNRTQVDLKDKWRNLENTGKVLRDRGDQLRAVGMAADGV
ncbi:MAG: hypothetical protein J3K34DRAFT_521308 [Monoraphidium minutum]|nr:MAG: hypothetical protein J3K34DRAFT_521308 [Monoraphidium minutum]